MKKKLFIIDGSAIAYRSYFAFIRNPFINSKGENTSAVFGFANTLHSLIKYQNPEYILVSFDTGAPTFRHNLYPNYKATREKMPDDMRSQIPEIHELLKAFNIKVIEKDGVEADDVIGSIARKASKNNFEVYILSGDKDFMQLICDDIKMYNIKSSSSDPEIIDVQKVKEKFNVLPTQITDLLGLMGDSSDNVPGVPQIGPKTASKLMNQFKSMEDIYENIDSVTPEKIKEKLIRFKNQAFLSKELVTIKQDLELNFTFDELKYEGFNTEKLIEFYKINLFRKFLKDLQVPVSQKDDAVYNLINTKDKWTKFFNMLKKQTCFAIDTETDNINPLEAKLVGISFSFKEDEAYYVPMNFGDIYQNDLFASAESNAEQLVLPLLKPILENNKVKKIGHNIKYDILVFSNYDIHVKGIYFDTMIASYLLNPTARQHNLDAISMFYLNYKKIPTSDLIGSGKKQISMAEVPVEKVSQYSCEDADMTLKLKNLFEERLKTGQLNDLFENVEMPLAEVLISMEKTGVSINVDFLKKMSGEFEIKLQNIEKNIHDLSGEIFNINSPQQLGNILFEKLEIQKTLNIKPKRTKIGYSTNSQVLESMAGHPLIDLILEYRQFTKLKSTYIDALPKLINKKTNRLHTSFNQTVTATGRLSSSSPNLQNIPVRTELGRKIRKAFIAGSSDTKLLSADYSQIELRILAHLSKDAKLLEAFQSAKDIHATTASLIFDVPMENVTKDLRSKAKAINFGIIYGMGQVKLARETGISQKEARAFIDAYFEKYPGIKNFIDETLDQTRKKGFVTTMLGRKREIPEIHSENSQIRVNAEHIAINTPIQGTCADMIKVAMINIYKQLEPYKTKMILQIHDELIFEVPANEIDTVKPIIEKSMENALPLDVPVLVKMSYADNWMDL